jgi:hypothetical protein
VNKQQEEELAMSEMDVVEQMRRVSRRALADRATPEYVTVDERAGKAMDVVMDDDRAFFKAHPERRLRVRRPHLIEHGEFDLTDDELPCGCEWYIVVEKLDVRFRTRNAFWAWPLHRPDQWSETACRRLLNEHCKVGPTSPL